MKIKEIIKNRYSVRKYEEKEVEKEKILEILEIMSYAPSCANIQPWHFTILRDEKMKAKVAKTYDREWIKKAPVIIVACGDHKSSWKRSDGKDHCDVDLAIAVDHLTLAASELGLGTCWVCNFDAKLCTQVLELPAHLEPIALIPLGYPLERELKEKQRKSLEEITSWIE